MAKKSVAKSPAPAQLDQKFWASFAKSYWEKKPLSVRNLQSSLREISAEEIFHLLVRYSDLCRKQSNPTGFKFYIDGLQCAAEDVLQVLPEKSDKSLLGYHARMNDLFEDYCLVCDELLRVNHQKQHLLTDFTDALYQHVGFPNRFSEMGLYLGNYRKTPFGVHVDACGVFSFPVVGTKRFRLWTSAYAKKNPGLDRAFKYEKYKKTSQLLEAGPGDMTYWPSSMWHIAESDGSFSATWSLGVWVDQPHQEMISDSLKNLLESKLGPAGQVPTTVFKSLHSDFGEVTELPETYMQSLKLLETISTSDFQEAFLKSWMKHISLKGFKNLPTENFKITANAQLKLRSQKSRILWQHSLTSKKTIFLSFGGILCENQNSKELLQLIKSLNSGETCLVGSHLKSSNKNEILATLQKFANAGAFSVN